MKKQNVTERDVVTDIVSQKFGGRWIKVTVVYRNLYHLSAALPLAVKLASEGNNMLYFARYTTPPFRVELQILTHSTMAKLRKTIMGFKLGNVSPVTVKFEPCNGSVPHAIAFNIVGTLRLSNKLTMAQLQDIVHWMYNMAGFSYVQEAASSCIQTYTALRNIPGWTDQPVFSAKPKAAQPVLPKKHVKHIKSHKN